MLSKQTSLKQLYALSPAQQNILHYMLQTADNTAYLNQLTFHIHSEIDAQLMHESWQTLTNHYDILRTIFVHKGLQPLQMALEHVDVEFRFTDIQRLTESEQQAYLDTFQQQDRQTGFNLYRDILNRVALFQLDSQHFVMVWTYHAILLDNHCSQLLQQALRETYDALKQQQTPALPKVTPYHHFTTWLNEQADASTYWQHYLHDYQAITSVPSDAETTEEQTAQYTMSLDEETSQQLYQLAAQHQTDINTVLQTAWGHLLGFYNNCQDVVFGIQSHLATEYTQPVVGLVNNIIPIRVRTENVVSFGELLQKIQRDLQAHQQHQHYAFANIQQHLQSDVIDHILCFEQPAVAAQSQHIQMQLADSFKHSGFGLVVSITPDTTGIQFQFTYHTNHYSHKQIQRVAAHIKQSLTTIANHPAISLAAINPLTPDETQQLLFEFNPQYRGETIDCNVIELLAAQVQKRGDKAALIYADKTLTYAELDQQSNQVAHYLIQQGIPLEQPVAVCMETGLELSIALWGILKAGAVYTFITPEHSHHYPITLANHSLDCPQAITVEAIIASTPTIHKPEIQIQNPHLAYISAQQPSVMAEHGNLVHFCANLASTFHWHHSDVVYTSMTQTDMAAVSLIGATVFGLTMVLPSQQPIEQDLQQHHISILQTTPHALQTLITSQGLSPLHNLSVIMLSGECLTPALHAQLQRLEHLLVFNLTDNPETTLASQAQCLQSDVETTDCILNEEAMYIISKQNELLPVGAVGEICIGGAGVTRGYMNQPQLTAQKFIEPDFLSQQPYPRLYKTGYVGRRLGNGIIEHIGKI